MIINYSLLVVVVLVVVVVVVLVWIHFDHFLLVDSFTWFFNFGFVSLIVVEKNISAAAFKLVIKSKICSLVKKIQVTNI